MQNNNTNCSYTKEFQTEVIIELKSLTIDASPEKPFDIFHYLQYVIPTSLIEDWDSKDEIPFCAEVECVLVSNHRPLTCPIILQSDQHFVMDPTFPNISILHNISREQHFFFWETTLLKLPISYSELPPDATLCFKFYVCLFEMPRKLIGDVKLRLFTQKKRRFRNGPFILGVGSSKDEPKAEHSLHRHVRQVVTGRSPTYGLYDDQARIIAESLHPDDAVKYYTSLYTPMTPPKLSLTSIFVNINIPSPAKHPSIPIIYSGMTFSSIYNEFSETLFQLSNDSSNNKIQKTLASIRAMPPLADITANYQSFIRAHYELCLKDPSLLSALFRSTNWDNEDDVNNLSKKLNELSTIDINYALEFFTPRFEHAPIRQYAVRCIKDSEHDKIQLFLPQLLQAVKFKYADGLTEVLIDHAKNDIVFASKLYWLASIDAEEDKIMNLIAHLMTSVPQNIKDEILAQKKLTDDLQKMLLKAKTKKNLVTSEVQANVRSLLAGEFAHLQRFAGPVRLPIDPTRLAVGIDKDSVGVFQSKLCPVRLMFHMEDGSEYKVLFKTGDDMRQDQLILQLFEVMDRIFQKASLQLNITIYRILAFSSKFGCCEFVENSRALYDIYETDKKTILSYLSQDNKEPLAEKIDRYTKSLAAYSVMTYILLIGDRHDNNIMLKTDGKLLHIDFGFILGDATKPFTPPIKLRNSMIEPIGPDGLNSVINFAGPAFNAIRKKAGLVLTIIEMMFESKIECFIKNPKKRLIIVENALMPALTDVQAMNNLKELFIDAINSKAMFVWDTVHHVAIAATTGNAN